MADEHQEVVDLSKQQAEDAVFEALEKAGVNAMVKKMGEMGDKTDHVFEVVKSTIEASAGKPDSDQAFPGQRAAQMILASVAPKVKKMDPASWSAQTYGENHPVTRAFAPDAQHALSTGSSTGGGWGLPTPSATEFVELLQAEGFVKDLGIRTINGWPSKTFPLPGLAGGATAYWVGEAASITASDTQFDHKNVELYKAAALMVFSREWMEYVTPSVERLVLDSALNALRILQDTAFLNSAGGENRPMGIRHLVDASMTDTAQTLAGAGNEIADITKIRQDFRDMELRLSDALIKDRNRWLIMSKRDLLFLRDQLDANGSAAFPELQNKNEFRMKKVMPLTPDFVPVTGGGGGDEAEIFEIEASELLMLTGSGVRVEETQDATIVDGATTRRLFQDDMVGVKMVANLGVGMLHTNGSAVLTEVKWGA